MYNLRSSCRIAALFWKHIRYFRARFPAESIFRDLSHIRYFRARFPAESVFRDLSHIRYFRAKFPPEVYFVTFRIFDIFR